MNFFAKIQNSDGSLIWELPHADFNFTEELNRGRSASIRFELNALEEIAQKYNVSFEEIVSGSYRELIITDENGNIPFAGYISSVLMSAGHNDKGNISLTVKGLFSLLEKRITSSFVFYDSEDLSDIAWDLIDDTQNNGAYGDLGITRGANPTTRNAQRTFRYRPIAEAIRKMSNDEIDDGIDFDIDFQKQLNVYYPTKGTQRANIILEEGFNIDTYSITKLFIDAMANQVTVVGAGDGDNQIVSVRDADNAYKSAFFLLQDVLTEKDVSLVTTLEEKGDVYLTKYREPRYVISMTCDYEAPLFTDYELGDQLKIKIPTHAIDGFYRVVKRSVNAQGVVNLSFSEI